jgi:hypothetical protein
MVRGRYDEELEEDDLPHGQREITEENSKVRPPLDDFDLPDDLINDSGERTIIAGKEVRIVDDENGFRIEFETAHDHDTSEDKADKDIDKSSMDESKTESKADEPVDTTDSSETDLKSDDEPQDK